MAEVMLITGAARGIGAATAKLAAARGYAVAISYRANRAAAERVLAAVTGVGAAAIVIACDVSREEDVCRMFETVDRDLGRLSVLVNNAGIVDHAMRVEAMAARRIERMLAVNVLGSFLCAREAVRRMSVRAGGTGGSIVNVSSAAARHGSPGEYVDYAATKAAIDTFTIGLAREVAADGIRVNAVRPGIIDTEIHANSGDADRAQRLAPTLPLGRAGSADEVARAILWLASNEASYATGAILDISGGR